MPGPRTGAAYLPYSGGDAPIERYDAQSGFGPISLSSDTESRLDAMRRHLTAARPSSGNEALRLLRAAFPHAPLSERVEAAAEVNRYAI